jgi:hypothetical protein
MDGSSSKQQEVHQRMIELLETLKANKPDDRSELDKVYAVAITDAQKLFAWWVFAYEGLPPYEVAHG